MLYTSKNNDLRVEKLVSFIQHDLPGVKSGKYQLRLSQSVLNNGKELSDNTLSAEYNIAITGDRFSLCNPATSIYSVFPAANASGKYETVLPSVVFPKTSFPWSRSPLKRKETKRSVSEPKGEREDVATWLTVILLDEKDLIAYKDIYPTFTLEPQTATVGDLFPKSMYKNSTLAQENNSYFDSESKSSKSPKDILEPGQQVTDRIQTLDIPLSLFQNIAPSIEDLKYMAHIRKVSLVNKATMSGISDIGEPEGDFSIVFGNRLPGANRKVWAYLVSLENMEAFLPPTTVESDGKLIRLAVLRSWTFYSTGDNASLTNKLKNLNRAEITDGTINKDLKSITSLHLPIPEESIPLVKNALRMGYVPLKHHLRSAKEIDGHRLAEKTVSWYRSPLCPHIVPTPRIKSPLTSADMATLYDPTTGIFDVSYACAWTLGRLMAVQDKAFATRLYGWKKHIQQKISRNMEEEHLMTLFADVFESTTETQNNELSAHSVSFIERTILLLKNKK